MIEWKEVDVYVHGRYIPESAAFLDLPYKQLFYCTWCPVSSPQSIECASALQYLLEYCVQHHHWLFKKYPTHSCSSTEIVYMLTRVCIISAFSMCSFLVCLSVFSFSDPR